ncbi:MAG: type IV pilus modification PilV family protein [Desulfoprunum sp.]
MKNLQNTDGFTLLEVIIALAIFTISIIALYTIQTGTINQNSRASRITTADSWASEKIEDIISAEYDDVEDKDDDGKAGLPHSTTATADGSEVSPDGVYTLLWNVAENHPLPNTKTVHVIVTNRKGGVGSLVDLEYIKHKG